MSFYVLPEFRGTPSLCYLRNEFFLIADAFVRSNVGQYDGDGNVSAAESIARRMNDADEFR